CVVRRAIGCPYTSVCSRIHGATATRSRASVASPIATRSSAARRRRRSRPFWQRRRQPANIRRIYQVFDIRTDIRPTVAELSVAALRKNVDAIAARVGAGVGILAVVKADAYGHGALAVARALERQAWGFAVSLVEEGVELRRGGLEAPIVVLG